MAIICKIPSSNLESGKKQFKESQDLSTTWVVPGTPPTGKTQIASVSHGLGYVPAFFPTFQNANFASGRRSYLPQQNFFWRLSAEADTTLIRFFFEEFDSFQKPSGTYTFKVRVALDQIE